MRIALIALVVATALLVSGCRVNPLGMGDKKDLVCSAAKAWIAADPSVKKKVDGELTSAVQKAESSTKEADRSNATKYVLSAAKNLLHGVQTAAAKRKIEKYC
ncbi:hypothetical protein [Amycolatopsis benzoatilytica]|uniref:hypothetical protein n=1 Tax=Amycolatopsis benzoatilytica TaxID=346045 RepID=UPI0003791B5F|nr:hypothetical protein [Amycolatopsis benzoatilytica]